MNYQELDLVILKTLLSNKKYAIEFVSEYDAKLFSPETWNFANILVSYIKNFKEPPSERVIEDKLKKTNPKLLESAKDILKHVNEIEYNENDFKYDVQKLKNRYIEKQILATKENLLKFESGSDISKPLNDIYKTIQSIKTLETIQCYDNKTLKEVLPSFVEKFNAKKNNPDYEPGLKTGYRAFDDATNGLKSADFVLIAGESGFGKSLLLNNMAVQVWMQKNTIETSEFLPGKNIVYFSLEMPYEDCFNRLLARLSNVPIKKIENAKLDSDEFIRIKKSLDFIKRYPNSFRIVDISTACANDLEKILNDCDEKFDAVFVDYLGIMEMNEKGEEQDWLKQGKISQEVRAIARKFNIPIFSAVQLNRKTPSKDSSENVGLERLARSATIATHCTHVIQIERRKMEEKYGNMILHLIKNRKGPKIKFEVIRALNTGSLLEPNNYSDEEQQLIEDFVDVDDISYEVEQLEL